jgi:hypothetical protein
MVTRTAQGIPGDPNNVGPKAWKAIAGLLK